MKLHQPRDPLESSTIDNLKKKILVVVDHPDMQTFLASILYSKYNVIKASNGLEGLKKAKNHAFELIISDVLMPEMDGFIFCNQIKSNIEILNCNLKQSNQLHQMRFYWK